MHIHVSDHEISRSDQHNIEIYKQNLTPQNQHKTKEQNPCPCFKNNNKEKKYIHMIKSYEFCSLP